MSFTDEWNEMVKRLKEYEPQTLAPPPTFTQWQGEPAEVDQIKRWIGDQRFIGYQKTDGVITHSVIQGRVELTDGRECDAWTIHGVGTLVPHTDKDGLTGFFTRKDWGTTTFQKPRIDQEPENWPAVPLSPEQSVQGVDALWPFIEDTSKE